MKKIVLILFIIVLLTGCTNNESTKVSINSEVDYRNDMQLYYHCAGSGYAPVTKSDTGYYYVSKGEDGKRFVVYVDRRNKKATPLCSKPDCMHNDSSTCNAFVNISEEIVIDSMFGSLGNAIQYYNGSIYMVCGEYDKSMIEYNTYLMKMDKDGGNRKKITGYFDSVITNWFIHRGYLYYTSDSSILRLPLDDTSGEPEVIYKAKYYIKGNENTFDELYAYQNHLYFIVNEKNSKGEGSGESSICLNIDTKKKKELKIGKYNAYFNTFAGDSMILSYVDNIEKVYYKADLEGNNTEKILSQNKSEITSVTSDGTYYYFDNGNQANKNSEIQQIITVRDKDMKIVDTFKLPEMDTGTYNFFAPQDENCFLFESYSNGKHTLLFADKSQIGKINGKTIKCNELCSLDYGNVKANEYAVKG